MRKPVLWILILGLAAPLLRAAPFAPNFETLVAGGTNFVAANSTNIYDYINAKKAERLSIAITYTFAAAPVGSTPTVTVRLFPSLNTYNFASNAGFTITANVSTNAATTAADNFLIGSLPFFRVSIANTNSAALTNVFIRFAQFTPGAGPASP